MIEAQAPIKRWGRSFGIIIPMDKIKEADLSENEIINIKIEKRKNPLKETFGILKFKKTTKHILKESGKEAWDE